MLVFLQIPVFLVCAGAIYYTVTSAIKTVVLPRSAPTILARQVFLAMRAIFNSFANPRRPYAYRDRVMSLYAQFTLLVLPVAWLAIILLSYMGIYWALGEDIWRAFTVSSSSLFTLGFSVADDFPIIVTLDTEALMGLALLALMISYLPTMYGAFSRRELAVTRLEVRAGSPPWAIEMILRFYRLGRLEELLHSLWGPWEDWFVDLEESHTSLAPLTFFRSPQPDRSWVTAAATIMDAAALAVSTLDIPRDNQAELCIRAGYLALRRISDFFRIPYNPKPGYYDSIRLTREEFNAAYEQLAKEGVPLKPDREQAWMDFKGWRVNYESITYILADLVMAPDAPWLPEKSRRK